jgi:hypothetical protein
MSFKSNRICPVYALTATILIVLVSSFVSLSQTKNLNLSLAEYEDRIHAVWVGQIAGTLIAWPYEHKTASVEWLDKYPTVRTVAPIDDDWYYEMIAIRAYEKYGTDLTLEELAQQWKENSAGSWGSSEQARLLLAKGVKASDVGHPRYNKLWFSIGPQFSADIYGALAPGMPNLTAKIARNLCHINGYAEGADGGIFAATMVSLAFSETDPKTIVRKAAKVINPESPYRKCLDLVISMADQGKTAKEIFAEVEDRWHIEYPATNNAVPNGGIIAASVWFGEGDFLKTVNLAAGAADFTDADCNAANAAAVIGAMHGMKGIPSYLVTALNDRITGDIMGGVTLTPAVDEKISDLARRTAVIGQKILLENGAKLNGNMLSIPAQQPVALSAELFTLADLTKYWNPDWQLVRAGFGGAGGGMKGIRGITYLDNDVLATYPRDEIRGLLLQRIMKVSTETELSFDVASDAKRAWNLSVFIQNDNKLAKTIEGGEKEQKWENIKIDLTPYRGKMVTIRLYQRVLVPGKEAGNAYWKNIQIK